ncbi:tetratricopeptide repeat protein [Flavobacterium crassostreae]|uniref:Tetratricopeptide repeat protein n=1 Tax=Flavobacterium crassostreae TaxID=1763534 RepID=A0A1B9DXT5_9FLAO|nr:tetratricopeptide repeat protein [Flavobacterium crassostreae]OCB74501.1 hypothetical protein LPBF_10980 [Flavobacterium crassostreae]
MNVSNYICLLNKPDIVTEQNVLELGSVLDEFPYFQSARALRLKGLYDLNSFKYNYALKVTAAHTTDRTILFDFITSDNFTIIPNPSQDQKEPATQDTVTKSSRIVPDAAAVVTKKETLEQVLETSIKKAASVTLQKEAQIATQNLAIGQPLDFTTKEKHSFQEWLQLSKTKPISRPETLKTNTLRPEELEEKKKQALLIDQFIQTSPKISPVKQGVSPVVQIDINKDESSYLMTETLAKVYLEQKKYQKAIQAYDILILKYPEKSSFFADRISDIKILQQNNN